MFWLFFLVMLLMCVVGMVLMPHGGHHSHRWFSAYGPGPYGSDVPPETPRQILDRRYANGEVEKERYQEMRAELDAQRPSDRI